MSEASQLTLFAEDFPVRTSPLREKARDLKASAAVYGQSSPVLLASYDHVTQSWRTSQHFLDEGLTEFSETWPRSGMMRNGIAYQLPPLALLTAGTESGLLPTPTASVGGPNHQSATVQKGEHGLNLAGYAQMWPTPRSCSAMAATITPESVWDPKRFPNLETVVGQRMWPTPCARDWKDNGKSPAELARNTKTLATHAGGQLNPTWVEWLMGFPDGWTDLSNLETP